MTELASGSTARKAPVFSSSHVFRKMGGSHAPLGVPLVAPVELSARSTATLFGDRVDPSSQYKW
jgi:hypothetical protein